MPFATHPTASTRRVADLQLDSWIDQTKSYLDTLEVQSWNHFPAPFVSELRKHCRHVIGPKEFPLVGNLTKCRLWIHQPQQRAIELLSDIPCHITSAHVALDLLTRSKEDAKELHGIIARHVMTKERPYQLVTQFHNTTYFHFDRTKGPRRNLVVYSDKTSKVSSNTSCTHIEMRIAGARFLEAAGLRDNTDILKLDHRKFWAGGLRLVDIPSDEEMGEEWCRCFMKRPDGSSRRFPYGSRSNAIRRIGHRFERISAVNEQGYFTANDLAYRLVTERLMWPKLPAYMFRDAGVNLILPSRYNALWFPFA